MKSGIEKAYTKVHFNIIDIVTIGASNVRKKPGRKSVFDK